MTQFLVFHNKEFENIVRELLFAFERELTLDDALLVDELDLSDFYFKEEDFETLFLFTNLKTLSINLDSGICARGFGDLFWTYWGNPIDFKVFSNMKNLNFLRVFGREDYDIPFKNLDALISLKKLERLELHNFGPVNFSPLSKMTQLKTLALHHNIRLQNISAISDMMQLQELILEHVYIENIEFLDYLPDAIYLNMNHIELLSSTNLDVKKWKRFKKRDIHEILARDRGQGILGEYIDLSVLDY